MVTGPGLNNNKYLPILFLILSYQGVEECSMTTDSFSSDQDLHLSSSEIRVATSSLCTLLCVLTSVCSLCG
jgi:hypothetical protein